MHSPAEVRQGAAGINVSPQTFGKMNGAVTTGTNGSIVVAFSSGNYTAGFNIMAYPNVELMIVGTKTGANIQASGLIGSHFSPNS